MPIAMILRNVLLSISLMAVLQASAQTLPPVFGNEVARTDGLERRYITPKPMSSVPGTVFHTGKPSHPFFLRQGKVVLA